MVDGCDVLALVPMVYDGALDHRAWQTFLSALNMRLLGSSSGLHLQRLGAKQSGHVLAGVGIDLHARHRYRPVPLDGVHPLRRQR